MQPDTFSSAVSATTPDWSREAVRGAWDPGRKLLRAIRRYQAAKARGGALAAVTRRYWVANHWFWSLLTQCDIPLTVRIGGGLVLPHPTGIVIHAESEIGPNCMVFQQVTLAGRVVAGGHCDFGAGAKVLGPLTLGDHVQVGANAVVTRDAGDLAVLSGVPAREIG
ncbi:Serine acetyltransferase [Roseivivax jejudonensis]|uniref:Serine acetyltransferase n=1 Tax=Roseivivax jejudonensis TaxID=1529041 RepID=A0A1X6Z1G0_9RHOB|nr:serine acetyltransferase [Roseivivax jejudonensis]SLN37976.1 Serine acetyltransferase [Roseivivax jejudonensis]